MGVSGPRSSPSGTGRRVSSALIDVVPETKSAQRPKGAASSTKVRTSSSALPRSIRPRETPTSAHLGDAEDRDHALAAATAVEVDRPPGRRPPRSSVPTSITSELLRGPGPHWVHVQTSTSIESSVSTLRLRTRVKRGLSRDRPVSPSPTHSSLGRGPLAFGNGSHLVALVRADATFRAGGGRVGPRDTGVAAGAAGRADSEVWGVPLSTGTSLRANEAAANN